MERYRNKIFNFVSLLCLKREVKIANVSRQWSLKLYDRNFISVISSVQQTLFSGALVSQLATLEGQDSSP